jgi:hypothetical protein
MAHPQIFEIIENIAPGSECRNSGMEMFSHGMKTTDQKEAAFCTRHTFWECVSSVIMPMKFPFPLQSYPRQLNTILWKM